MKTTTPKVRNNNAVNKVRSLAINRARFDNSPLDHPYIFTNQLNSRQRVTGRSFGANRKLLLKTKQNATRAPKPTTNQTLKITVQNRFVHGLLSMLLTHLPGIRIWASTSITLSAALIRTVGGHLASTLLSQLRVHTTVCCTIFVVNQRAFKLNEFRWVDVHASLCHTHYTSQWPEPPFPLSNNVHTNINSSTPTFLHHVRPWNQRQSG